MAVLTAAGPAQAAGGGPVLSRPPGGGAATASTSTATGTTLAAAATASGTATASTTAAVSATSTTSAPPTASSTGPATQTASDSPAATASATAPAVSLAPGFAIERVLSGLDAPVGVAVDRSGNVFVAEEDGSGTILRLTPDNGVSVVASGLPLPVGGVAVDQGRIDVAAGDAIYRIDPDAATGTVRRTLAVGLHGPLTGLALGPDGRLYVALLESGHLAAMPAGGGTVTTLVTGLFGPAGVAAGPGGDLYVVDDGQKGADIERVGIPVQPREVTTTVATVPLAAEPVGIAFEPRGPFGNGTVAYVTVVGGVDAINVTTGKVSSLLRAGQGPAPVRPAGLAFAPGGRTLYVVDAGPAIAGLPVKGAGSLWKITPAVVVNPVATPALPAIQVTPAPGPHNKVRAVPGPLPWYRDVRVLYAGSAGLLLVGALLLLQFRRILRRP